MEDRHYHSIDEIIEEIKGKSVEELASEPWDGPCLISVDELRAAGALDVPPAWRKSLSAGCDRSSGLFDDEDLHQDERKPASREPDSDVTADEDL